MSKLGGDGQAEGKGGGLEEDGTEDGKINLRKNLDATIGMDAASIRQRHEIDRQQHKGALIQSVQAPLRAIGGIASQSSTAIKRADTHT